MYFYNEGHFADVHVHGCTLEHESVTDLVFGISGPAMISLSRRLNAFLPVMPTLAPRDHTMPKRNVPCVCVCVCVCVHMHVYEVVRIVEFETVLEIHL